MSEALPLNEGSDLERERVLIERAPNDPLALAELYRMHVDAVRNFAWRRSGSRTVADEVTSATFERTLGAIEHFEWRGSGLRPWLLRVASNEMATAFRQWERTVGRRAQLTARDIGLHDEQSDDHLTTLGEQLDSMTAAVSDLYPRYRQVIELRYFRGLSTEEVAAEMGCSKTVVSVTLHRALLALRRSL